MQPLIKVGGNADSELEAAKLLHEPPTARQLQDGHQQYRRHRRWCRVGLAMAVVATLAIALSGVVLLHGLPSRLPGLIKDSNGNSTLRVAVVAGRNGTTASVTATVQPVSTLHGVELTDFRCAATDLPDDGGRHDIAKVQVDLFHAKLTANMPSAIAFNANLSLLDERRARTALGLSPKMSTADEPLTLECSARVTIHLLGVLPVSFPIDFSRPVPRVPPNSMTNDDVLIGLAAVATTSAISDGGLRVNLTHAAQAVAEASAEAVGPHVRAASVYFPSARYGMWTQACAEHSKMVVLEVDDVKLDLKLGTATPLTVLLVNASSTVPSLTEQARRTVRDFGRTTIDVRDLEQSQLLRIALQPRRLIISTGASHLSDRRIAYIPSLNDPVALQRPPANFTLGRPAKDSNMRGTTFDNVNQRFNLTVSVAPIDQWADDDIFFTAQGEIVDSMLAFYGQVASSTGLNAALSVKVQLGGDWASPDGGSIATAGGVMWNDDEYTLQNFGVSWRGDYYSSKGLIVTASLNVTGITSGDNSGTSVLSGSLSTAINQSKFHLIGTGECNGEAGHANATAAYHDVNVGQARPHITATAMAWADTAAEPYTLQLERIEWSVLGGSESGNVSATARVSGDGATYSLDTLLINWSSGGSDANVALTVTSGDPGDKSAVLQGTTALSVSSTDFSLAVDGSTSDDQAGLTTSARYDSLPGAADGATVSGTLSVYTGSDKAELFGLVLRQLMWTSQSGGLQGVAQANGELHVDGSRYALQSFALNWAGNVFNEGGFKMDTSLSTAQTEPPTSQANLLTFHSSVSLDDAHLSVQADGSVVSDPGGLAVTVAYSPSEGGASCSTSGVVTIYGGAQKPIVGLSVRELYWTVPADGSVGIVRASGTFAIGDDQPYSLDTMTCSWANGESAVTASFTTTLLQPSGSGLFVSSASLDVSESDLSLQFDALCDGDAGGGLTVHAQYPANDTYPQSRLVSGDVSVYSGRDRVELGGLAVTGLRWTVEGAGSQASGEVSLAADVRSGSQSPVYSVRTFDLKWYPCRPLEPGAGDDCYDVTAMLDTAETDGGGPQEDLVAGTLSARSSRRLISATADGRYGGDPDAVGGGMFTAQLPDRVDEHTCLGQVAASAHSGMSREVVADWTFDRLCWSVDDAGIAGNVAFTAKGSLQGGDLHVNSTTAWDFESAEQWWMSEVLDYNGSAIEARRVQFDLGGDQGGNQSEAPPLRFLQECGDRRTPL